MTNGIDKTISYIFNNFDYPGREVSKEVSKEQKTRIQEHCNRLGLELLFDKDFNCTTKRSSDISTKIESAMWIKADKITNKRVFVSQKDVKNAIDFLELFALHAKDTSHEEQNVEKIEGWLEKTCKHLDKLDKGLGSSQEKILKVNVTGAIHNLNKLFDCISETEKIALVGKVNTAEKILKKYFK